MQFSKGHEMQLRYVHFVVVFIVLSTLQVRTYDILGIFHFPARSSVVTFTRLFQALVAKGHNLTLISNFKLQGIGENYHEIILSPVVPDPKSTSLNELGKISEEKQHFLFEPTVLAGFNKKLCEMLFNSKGIQDLYRSGMKFDLVMVHIFQSECVYQVAKQFDCPIMGIHSTRILTWSGRRFGLPNNPAYITNNFMPFSDKMNFWERLSNSMATWCHSIYYNYVMVGIDKEAVREYYGDEEASKLDTYGYNTSLFMVNTHYTVTLSRPLLPNVIEVGGIHINRPKPLPKVISII